MSVREEQAPGTYVVRIRAIDRDNGYNASITYSLLKGRDSDGFGLFTIDATTGIIRTRVALDHEERSIYRLAIAANDGGKPSKQTVRLLRVEVLNLNDHRPTFTSSSLIYKVIVCCCKNIVILKSDKDHLLLYSSFFSLYLKINQ